MGVVRVVGQVDGEDVVFHLDESGKWVYVAARDLDGEYIVEVTAYDEAGNAAYSAAMLFAVDTTTLSVSLRPLNYAYQLTDNEYEEEIIRADFLYYVTDEQTTFTEQPQNYTAKVV